MDISIRQATAADAQTVAEFNLRLASETEDLALDLVCVSAGVSTVLKDSAKGLYYLAEIDGQVAGQVMITYEWSDWRNGNLWWLQSVYVRPEFRGRGVFRALFKHLEQRARMDPGVAGLRLYMHAENHRARQTYEALGMRQTKYLVFERDLGRGAAG